MTTSPFRGIVLPALLASSAGFALLTWPMTFPNATSLSTRLPTPVSRWIMASPKIDQHEEFSIRYVGVAILSSVVIGIGTAETMRSRQFRAQRRQTLLQTALTTVEPLNQNQLSPWSDPEDLGMPYPLSLGETSSLDGAAADPAQGLPLDWVALLQSPPDADSQRLSTASVKPPLTVLESYRPCRIQAVDGQRYLAIQVGGDYYRFYRRRPSLDKAQSLVNQLQRWGSVVTITHDDKGYGIWVHQPDAQLDSAPKSMLTALS
ncbi:MAG: hypothetical protein ACFCVD_04780 [Nodosilinea sp.]